jgi:hypothetical protein
MWPKKRPNIKMMPWPAVEAAQHNNHPEDENDKNANDEDEAPIISDDEDDSSESAGVDKHDPSKSAGVDNDPDNYPTENRGMAGIDQQKMQEWSPVKLQEGHPKWKMRPWK